ncbi:Porin subfamily protein [Devosia enhydra]|uniref:Porin n=1 Tax=Devosia enhydra TaxID=665118 RepID=A0A1K2HWK2_9HYPH|nr:porin [Devosia enhydra]SFZ83381.1 Porin subfamily protein [Devosia enhydra]
MILRTVSALALVFATAGALILPAQAEPVDYVRVCDGDEGTAYIPGTDECTELGGSADGAAIALALPGAVIDAGKTFGVGVNVGTFGGSTAIGLSGAFQASDGLTFNGAVGLASGGAVGGRAGANFSW